jgi:hypothetical protein
VQNEDRVQDVALSRSTATGNRSVKTYECNSGEDPDLVVSLAHA